MTGRLNVDVRKKVAHPAGSHPFTGKKYICRCEDAECSFEVLPSDVGDPRDTPCIYNHACTDWRELVEEPKKELRFVMCNRDEDLLFHYMMLTRQMTRLADCFTHIIRTSTQIDGRHGGANLDYRGWVVYSQSEIADMLSQVKKLCDVLDVDFVETYCMGMKRDAEKKKEYLEKHPNDAWI